MSDPLTLQLVKVKNLREGQVSTMMEKSRESGMTVDNALVEAGLLGEADVLKCVGQERSVP